jgi:hypothetical protein
VTSSAELDCQAKRGVNRKVWNLRYEGATVFEEIILEGPNPTSGPWAPPGSYAAKLTVDDVALIQPFDVNKRSPLGNVTQTDLQAHFQFALQIRGATSTANRSVVLIREVRNRLRARLRKSESAKLIRVGNEFLERITRVEGELYQVHNQASKDKIAFPIKLNNRLSALRGLLERGDARPTPAHYAVYRELVSELERLTETLNAQIPSSGPKVDSLLSSQNLAPAVGH